MEEIDVLVIGEGPTGFISVQIASQLGGKVILVEKERVRGVYPNWGCVPI